MSLLCYRRHRFTAEIIQHAIWLYLRFTLSYRDVKELLAERGLDISYETVRRWVLNADDASATAPSGTAASGRNIRPRRPFSPTIIGAWLGDRGSHHGATGQCSGFPTNCRRTGRS
jgi:hypothetical protein